MSDKLGRIARNYAKRFGRVVGLEKLRRWEAEGLIKFERDDNGFRKVDDIKEEEAFTLIHLLETGFTKQALKEKDALAYEQHIRWLRYIAPLVRKPRNWS